MNTNNDAMGRAIVEYYEKGKASKLRVFSPMFEEDEIPVELLFRRYEQMPELEQKALTLAKGKVLDVGAGAGCHSLYLQDKGFDVTALDISSLSIEVMKKRGVKNTLCQDFFSLEGKYDTILMLMNGIGLVGKVEKLNYFFKHLDNILNEGGQVLCDSSDICYIFEEDDGSFRIPLNGDYYGELTYQMQYKDTKGEEFDWLYIDFQTLESYAKDNGFKIELVEEGSHYDYLCRIFR